MHRINTEIATKLKARLEQGLREEWYGEHLVQVIVELKRLGSSSLDIITIAKFGGEAASEYTEIHWKLQQLALEASNESGWVVPFQQLAIHHADSVPEPQSTASPTASMTPAKD